MNTITFLCVTSIILPYIFCADYCSTRNNNNGNTTIPFIHVQEHRKIAPAPSVKQGQRAAALAESRIRQNSSRNALNVLKLMNKNSYKLMCDVILGKRYGGPDEDNELENHLRSVEALDSWELRYILEGIFPHSILKGFMVRMAKNIFGQTIKTMNSVMKYRKQSKKEGKSEMNAISDFLVEEDEAHNLNDETFELHLGTLAVAVTASMATVAANLIFELAQHPEVQNKCHEEITKVLEKHDGKITFEAMKYFEMFFRDGLRKHGTSFVMDRICAAKYLFPGTNLSVDKGVRVYFPVDAIRSDPKHFPDPEKIIPERFSPENKDNIHPVGFMGFGYGPRQCIGKAISQLLLTMTLVRFLQRFKIEPSGRTPKVYKTNPASRVRKPLGGEIWLNIVRRNVDE